LAELLICPGTLEKMIPIIERELGPILRLLWVVGLAVLLSLLNAITLGEDTRIDTYPGLIKVYFDNDRQCDRARERAYAIERVLDTAVAAGVQWQVFFPYVRYTMDLLLHRLNIPKNYYMDTLILKLYLIAIIWILS